MIQCIKLWFSEFKQGFSTVEYTPYLRSNLMLVVPLHMESYNNRKIQFSSTLFSELTLIICLDGIDRSVTPCFVQKQYILSDADVECLLYRVIQNDCRGFNNLSYTKHLRQEYVVAPTDQEILSVFFCDVRCAVVMHFYVWRAVY